MSFKKYTHNDLIMKVEQLDAIMTLILSNDEGQCFASPHSVISTAIHYASDSLLEIRDNLRHLNSDKPMTY